MYLRLVTKKKNNKITNKCIVPSIEWKDIFELALSYLSAGVETFTRAFLFNMNIQTFTSVQYVNILASSASDVPPLILTELFCF